VRYTHIAEFHAALCLTMLQRDDTVRTSKAVRLSNGSLAAGSREQPRVAQTGPLSVGLHLLLQGIVMGSPGSRQSSHLKSAAGPFGSPPMARKSTAAQAQTGPPSTVGSNLTKQGTVVGKQIALKAALPLGGPLRGTQAPQIGRPVDRHKPNDQGNVMGGEGINQKRRAPTRIVCWPCSCKAGPPGNPCQSVGSNLPGQGTTVGTAHPISTHYTQQEQPSVADGIFACASTRKEHVMVTESPERLRPPDRPVAVTLRLSLTELARLETFARREDLRLGQAARRIVNAALDTEADAPRDGHAAR